MRKLAPIAFTALALSGCGTIVSGTQQSIFVDTPHVDGAECKLTDSKKGAWHLPSTPGSVSVLKGDGPMNVVCTKEGYERGITSVDETLAGATLGNIILGGGVGFLVDAASGAAQKYPDSIVVWMKPTSWSSEEEKQSWLQEKRDYEAAQAKLREEQNKNKPMNSTKG